MEQNIKMAEPDNTAVRTALWRAMHIQVDAKPYVLEDEVGLKLIAPNGEWREICEAFLFKHHQRISLNILR